MFEKIGRAAEKVATGMGTSRRGFLGQALVAGKPGARFDVVVERVAGHAHLPIVRLRRAS
jgi:hypothetical protein